MKRNGELRGDVCSTGSTVNPCWKNIWGLKVSPRVKSFIWKCVNNILPTKDRLRRRGVLVNSNYVLCKNASENLLHLFLHCPFSCRMWFSTPLNMCTTGYPWASFKEWWAHMSTQFHTLGCPENLDSVACVLWYLWKYRNGVVFGDEVLDGEKIWQTGYLLDANYKSACSKPQTSTLQQQGRTSESWLKPIQE
ncbi:hypothetical protein LIER_19617 [Lithospermum erythrorhizon]|uniref:Reverse transcriptase zinc-binding domain-containing protein n=1 Tax=Lithospermum erythrorhizon TaxID=34254 RepID=A0AAV3QJZ1_LITER